MKSLLPQVKIIKISTSRLRKGYWNLEVPYDELTVRNECIRVGSSQLLRWLSESSNKEYNDNIVSVVINSIADFIKVTNSYGFVLNSHRYLCLLGTSGGVKQNTLLFARADKIAELNKRINNGRNEEIPLVPAKFEAYKSLVASVSIPLSKPNKMIVVKDIETTFRDEILLVDGSQTSRENPRPTLTYIKDYEVSLTGNDGLGLVSPKLMAKWSLELKERTDEEDEYICGGICLRNAFLKGMVFPFDYIKFAEEVAHTYEVTDIYGETHDIREVDLIITESQLKLWNCYENTEEYLRNCEENNYDFCACKVSERHLEDTRRLNYQYLQSYEDLSDEDIKELCKPTLEWLEKSSGGDWKSVLDFLGASGDSGFSDTQLFIKAIKANPQVLQDKWISDKINKLLIKKKDEAKIGKLICEGNYQIIGGDLYALCQGIFGMKITGLLKPNTIYSSYWVDKGIEEVLLYRSPMTSHNNIRRVKLDSSDSAREWYKYATNVMFLSCFDTITMALNGADFDGDTVFSTNNKVLLRNTKDLPAINCIQQVAKKELVTYKNLREANRNGFGNEVGTVTNRVTSMFDILALYPKGSEEYEELMYRITVSQHYQQLSIDKVKGIVAEPMDKKWYTAKECINDFDKRVVCDKKPYFMTYIYSNEKAKYKQFVEVSNMRTIIKYGASMEELKAKLINGQDREILKLQLGEQRYMELLEDISIYCNYSPISNNNCVMNRICRYMEFQLKSINAKLNNEAKDFDYNILKSKNENMYIQDKEITKRLKDCYQEYRYLQGRGLSKLTKSSELREDISNSGISAKTALLYKYVDIVMEDVEKFNIDTEALTNTLVDIVYATKDRHSSLFLWVICGNQILKNLKENNDTYSMYEDKELKVGNEKNHKIKNNK